MDNAPWDVIVIGGGISGAGIARDCAMRGLKTLLLEKGKPGNATTASSTHLIHGGLRYLLYDRLTTWTTSWDSGKIVRIAGKLLSRLPILWPVYKNHRHGLETVETLLESYDRFQVLKGGYTHLRLSAQETARLVPGLKTDGLLGSVSFDEWWVDPVALVRATLDSAREHGAEVRTEAGAAAPQREGSKITGVQTTGGTERARLVINASGPWIQEVARMAGADIDLRLQKGTHLVYEKRLVPVGLLLEAEDRERYVFVVPSPQGTLVGPTDLATTESPDELSSSAGEIRYLLSSLKRYFPDFPERFDATTVGARPILGRSGNEKLLSRGFEVFDHASRDGIDGFVTLGGGKMSDFRLMAEAATDLVCRKLGVVKDCRTFEETLWGEPLEPVSSPPKPPRSLKRVLDAHPRLRQAHALFFLGIAFLGHAIRRTFKKGRFSSAAEFLVCYPATSLGVTRPKRVNRP